METHTATDEAEALHHCVEELSSCLSAADTAQSGVLPMDTFCSIVLDLGGYEGQLEELVSKFGYRQAVISSSSDAAAEEGSVVYNRVVDYRKLLEYLRSVVRAKRPPPPPTPREPSSISRRMSSLASSAAVTPKSQRTPSSLSRETSFTPLSCRSNQFYRTKPKTAMKGSPFTQPIILHPSRRHTAAASSPHETMLRMAKRVASTAASTPAPQQSDTRSVFTPFCFVTEESLREGEADNCRSNGTVLVDCSDTTQHSDFSLSSASMSLACSSAAGHGEDEGDVQHSQPLLPLRSIFRRILGQSSSAKQGGTTTVSKIHRVLCKHGLTSISLLELEAVAESLGLGHHHHRVDARSSLSSASSSSSSVSTSVAASVRLTFSDFCLLVARLPPLGIQQLRDARLWRAAAKSTSQDRSSTSVSPSSAAAQQGQRGRHSYPTSSASRGVSSASLSSGSMLRLDTENLAARTLDNISVSSSEDSLDGGAVMQQSRGGGDEGYVFVPSLSPTHAAAAGVLGGGPSLSKSPPLPSGVVHPHQQPLPLQRKMPPPPLASLGDGQLRRRNWSPPPRTPPHTSSASSSSLGQLKETMAGGDDLVLSGGCGGPITTTSSSSSLSPQQARSLGQSKDSSLTDTKLSQTFMLSYSTLQLPPNIATQIIQQEDKEEAADEREASMLQKSAELDEEDMEEAMTRFARLVGRGAQRSSQSSSSSSLSRDISLRSPSPSHSHEVSARSPVCQSTAKREASTSPIPGRPLDHSVGGGRSRMSSQQQASKSQITSGVLSNFSPAALTNSLSLSSAEHTKAHYSARSLVERSPTPSRRLSAHTVDILARDPFRLHGLLHACTVADVEQANCLSTTAFAEVLLRVCPELSEDDVAEVVALAGSARGGERQVEGEGLTVPYITLVGDLMVNDSYSRLSSVSPSPTRSLSQPAAATTVTMTSIACQTLSTPSPSPTRYSADRSLSRSSQGVVTMNSIACQTPSPHKHRSLSRSASLPSTAALLRRSQEVEQRVKKEQQLEVEQLEGPIKRLVYEAFHAVCCGCRPLEVWRALCQPLPSHPSRTDGSLVEEAALASALHSLFSKATTAPPSSWIMDYIVQLGKQVPDQSAPLPEGYCDCQVLEEWLCHSPSPSSPAAVTTTTTGTAVKPVTSNTRLELDLSGVADAERFNKYWGDALSGTATAAPPIDMNTRLLLA